MFLSKLRWENPRLTAFLTGKTDFFTRPMRVVQYTWSLTGRQTGDGSWRFATSPHHLSVRDALVIEHRSPHLYRRMFLLHFFRQCICLVCESSRPSRTVPLLTTCYWSGVGTEVSTRSKNSLRCTNLEFSQRNALFTLLRDHIKICKLTTRLIDAIRGVKYVSTSSLAFCTLTSQEVSFTTFMAALNRWDFRIW